MAGEHLFLDPANRERPISSGQKSHDVSYNNLTRITTLLLLVLPALFRTVNVAV